VNDTRASSWERYFVTYWWVFAALGTIAVVMTGLLYLEQDTGKRLIDWCTFTCAMFGGLIGALLIVLTYSYQRKQEEEGRSTTHLSQLETRVHILEGADEPGDKGNPASHVLFFNPKNAPKG